MAAAPSGLALVVLLALFMVAMVVGFGWLVPMAVGIYRQVKGKSPKVAYVITGIWAAGALALLAVTIGGGYWVYHKGSQAYQANMPQPAENYQGAKARVTIPFGTTASYYVITDDGKSYQDELNAPGGEVPAGNVASLSLNTDLYDARQNHWLLTANPSVGNLMPGSTMVLRADTCLTATVQAQPGEEGQYVFSLALQNSLGERCTVQKLGSGNTPNLSPAPRLIVTDASGQQVLSGYFEYG